MLSSYSNDALNNAQMNNTGSYNFNNLTGQNPVPTLNSYGAEYVNNTKENRSKYGNYLDNSLAYDPNKQQKSAFNVVYQPDIYNPWGKPGGGAPKLNNNTGQLQTKIVGTLQWNLNGETEQDRIARTMNNNRSKTNANLNMYRKNQEMNSPRNIGDAVRTNTTYNYNFREPIGPQQSQGLPSFPQSSPGRMEQPVFNANNGSQNDLYTPKLQQEAERRNLERSGTMQAQSLRPKGYCELNRLANKLNTDNQPTTAYPNMSYWFGRTGQHKTTIGSFPSGNVGGSQDFSSDPRRRKLLDQLEHRSPRDVPKVYGLDNNHLPNANIAFVNDPHSNHRNNYENNQM